METEIHAPFPNQKYLIRISKGEAQESFYGKLSNDSSETKIYDLL